MRPEALRRFRRILREFERLMTRQNRLCCSGITLAQCHTLLEVETMGEATTGMLAKALGLDKSTVSLTIDALVKRRLVQRTPHRSDRRITLLTLTTLGKTSCDEINRANDVYYTAVFRKIPEGIHQDLIELFDRFVEAFAERERERTTHQDCCDCARD